MRKITEAERAKIVFANKIWLNAVRVMKDGAATPYWDGYKEWPTYKDFGITDWYDEVASGILCHLLGIDVLGPKLLSYSDEERKDLFMSISAIVDFGSRDEINRLSGDHNPPFDANTDYITGVEIPVADVLQAGIAQPFGGDGYEDGFKHHWADAAALGILKDLSWRNSIGKAFKSCDVETRRALVDRLSDIILEAEYSSDFRNPNRAAREKLNERLDDTRAMLDEREVHISELSLELQDERSKRIFAQQTLDDERSKPGYVSHGDVQGLAAETRRLLDAKAALLELEADEKRGKFSALEDQLSEAVAKADIADYSRECFAARCKDLEAKIEKVSDYAGKYRGSYLMCDVLDIVTGDESTPPPHSVKRIRNENERFKPRVVGADIQNAGGLTTVTVSETIEPDGTVGGPTNTMTVTTTGTDVVDVLYQHKSLVAFHCQDTSDREWQGTFVFVGDECFAIRVPLKDGDRFLEAMRKFTAAESEAA